MELLAALELDNSNPHTVKPQEPELLELQATLAVQAMESQAAEQAILEQATSEQAQEQVHHSQPAINLQPEELELHTNQET